ncbi:hypothetical protein [Sulfurimonas sp.]|uniref:hypothetical protein n=1 Tax=Sulfurimonas sp. TaxID=2022749 RepID=UPI002B47BAE3|nr:hypothetical protein [Sulfurimonas sp.]
MLECQNKEESADLFRGFNYRRFHETLKYNKPMNIYYDNLKVNDENYIKFSENVA